MAIEGNDEILSDDEIEARQRAIDGETDDHNPIDEEPGDEGEEAKPDDAEAPADAAAVAAAQAEAAEKEAATLAAATEAAAAKAAGAEEAKPARPEGVLSKDGTRVLPFTALQAERRGHRAAAAQARRLESELEKAQQQIADLKAGKTIDSDELTEDKVADMEANFPEEGKRMRAAFNRIQELEKLVPKADAATDDSSDDPIQDAVDQVPLLLEWQNGDAEKFARAVEHDAVLMKSPKWAGRPVVERFEEAARRTADEYDIAFPETKPKPSTTAAAAPAATPSPAAQTAQRKHPETLSDFKGGSIADHNSLDISKTTPVALLDRMSGMTDEQIDAHLAKYGG